MEKSSLREMVYYPFTILRVNSPLLGEFYFMPESNGLKIEQDFKSADKPVSVLAPAEKEQLTFITNRATNALSQINQSLHEFNGLDFLKDDQVNRDTRNSFIRPKLNDDEVRINTGTVEKKMMTVVNEVLNLNMSSEVLSFDENDRPVQELGEVFTEVLKRSHELEDEDDLKFPMLWDLATRRIMFCEEYQEYKEVVDKRKKKYDMATGETEFESKKYCTSKPKKRLVDPRSILLGDMSIPIHRFNDQPFIIKYDRMHWRNFQTFFQSFKNFRFVRAGAPTGDFSWCGGEFDWRLFSTLASEEVELIYYYSYPDDEYQIIANGVPMLKPGSPLPWEYEGYMIQGFVFREMEQNLAYGQLFTINAKVLATLGDEMLRLIVRKWRQSIEPPTVTKGTKVLSRDIWAPGATASGISKDDVQKLIETGITESEMSTFNLISQKIEDEVGVSKLFQGQTDKRMTATQTIEQMKQAIKAIGLLVISWMRVVRVMDYLRIYNIIENNINPVGLEYKNGKPEKVLKRFTIANAKLDSETEGTMVVEFGDEDLNSEEEEQLYEMEETEKKQGHNIRYKRINSEKLRQFRLHWFLSVSPQEKESTALQRIMFTDQLNQAAGVQKLTGRKLNSNTIVGNYERIWKAKNMFERVPTLPVVQEGMEKGTTVPSEMATMADNTPAGSEMESGISASVKRPGVNSMVNETA